MIIVSRKNGMQMTPEQSIQSHMDSIHSLDVVPHGLNPLAAQSHMDSIHSVDAVPHGLDPLAAEDAEDDHERVKEVGEVPARHGREVLLGVVAAVQLHAHHGEDEHDNGQHDAQVAERSHRPTDDSDEQIQRRPRLGQLEHPQLPDTRIIVALTISTTVTAVLFDTVRDTGMHKV